MSRLFSIASFVTLWMVLQPVGWSAEPLPAPSRCLPPDAIAILQWSQPKDLLDVVFDSPLRQTITTLPEYKEQTSKPGFRQFVGMVRYLEGRLDTDLEIGLDQLLGGGVTVALYPKNTVVAIVDAKDEALLHDLHEILLEFAKNEAEKKGRNSVVPIEYQGAKGWTFGKNEVHAILGNRIILSNQPEMLKSVLDLHANPTNPKTKSLASSPAYQAARKTAKPNRAASIFVNFGVLKQLPAVKKALEPNDNPMLALLFGGVAETLQDASWLAVGFARQGDGLLVDAVADGRPVDPSGLMAFSVPHRTGEGALPNFSVPRQIASLSFYRDLHAFYAAKDELFPERTSGLIFFENMMGIFFTGRDLTEEVLGETHPEIRVVVAEQQYDPAVGTPRVQMPALAIVFRLRRPEQFSQVVEEAWQKAVGLVNFTRGQNALPGLIIDRPVHEGVKFTVAGFAPPTDDERAKAEEVDTRFNYQPSLAMVGEHLVLGSTEDLTADLIDALRAEIANPTKPLAGTHAAVTLNAARLAHLLELNQENLIRQDMIKKGNTHEQSKAQWRTVLTVLKILDQAELGMRTQADRPEVTLSIGRP